jgi:intracellular septation protein
VTAARENIQAPQRPLLKLALEIGPLVVFFLVNGRAGIFWATGAFMVAIAVALPIAWRVERRLPIMPLVTAVFVMVFGGLTLILHDETFIKLKPTLVNLLFAAALFGGLMFKTALLKPLFGPVFQLTEKGWRVLTLRWALFFIVLAVLNEAVWRTQTTEFWIQFKLFAIMPLTLVFSMLQLPLINRYRPGAEETES